MQDTETSTPKQGHICSYLCPTEKSDHVVLEFQTLEGSVTPREESHWHSRYSYKKANFTGLRKYFEEGDWKELKQTMETEDHGNFLVILHIVRLICW